MQITEPKVFLVGETTLVKEGMAAFLADIGAGSFKTDAATDAEALCEIGGRLCYLSFEAGMNKNVTRIRQGNKNYIGNLLTSGHGSVLAHASVNFVFTDVTCVLTHELVRHGVGTAFSQQSGRYCRITEIGFYMGDGFENAVRAGMMTDAAVAMIERETLSLLEALEAYQLRVAELAGLDDMANFDLKKQITSQMRRLAPYGIATKIMFSANHRAIRHIIDMRNGVHAEEEVRKAFYQVASMMKDRYPAIYQDMELAIEKTPWGNEAVWKFTNPKV